MSEEAYNTSNERVHILYDRLFVLLEHMRDDANEYASINEGCTTKTVAMLCRKYADKLEEIMNKPIKDTKAPLKGYMTIEGSEPAEIRILRHSIERDLIVTLYQLEEEEINLTGYMKIRARLGLALDNISLLQQKADR